MTHLNLPVAGRRQSQSSFIDYLSPGETGQEHQDDRQSWYRDVLKCRSRGTRPQKLHQTRLGRNRG